MIQHQVPDSRFAASCQISSFASVCHCPLSICIYRGACWIKLVRISVAAAKISGATSVAFVNDNA